MRYPASEKLEIIRLVEQSHLPARRTLEKLGVSRATFYRWCDLYQTGGPEALEDRSSQAGRVWNRIPDAVRGQVVQLALDEPELSPRELATRFTDTKSYFVSEASVYRLLKAHDLIASPAYIVMKAADEFKDKTTAPNQLWQTDFTYLKVIRLGGACQGSGDAKHRWMAGGGLVLSQHDLGRLLALHHCLEALHDDEDRGRHGNTGPGAASLGARSVHVVHRPRLLSDNGPSYSVVAGI